MKTNRRILLYGNSVILESIGASLQRSAEFNVKTITTPTETDRSCGTLPFDLESTLII